MIILKLFKSIKKGMRLSAFQRKYLKIPDVTQDVANYSNNSVKRKQVLKSYLEFCLSDTNIQEIAKCYSLSHKDFEEIFWRLTSSGLSQYIKGHYVSMSSLAYAEPLEYIVVKLREGEDLLEISSMLLKYWEEDLPMGSLLKSVFNSEYCIKR